MVIYSLTSIEKLELEIQDMIRVMSLVGNLKRIRVYLMKDHYPIKILFQVNFEDHDADLPFILEKCVMNS